MNSLALGTEPIFERVAIAQVHPFEQFSSNRWQGPRPGIAVGQCQRIDLDDIEIERDALHIDLEQGFGTEITQGFAAIRQFAAQAVLRLLILAFTPECRFELAPRPDAMRAESDEGDKSHAFLAGNGDAATIGRIKPERPD
ncbi:hypothetical protein AAG612_01015 [Citromicrobium bathyomarinum]|uniref:hypothetical protein n=1 Tax=Citromicrobium bathyomarinum TaxID=72174 RepID=UPI00315AE3D6